jgi:hypothetical protein
MKIIIEYNETSVIKSYADEALTPKLLSEIKAIDESIETNNETLNVGYVKMYFDFIDQKGKVIEHLRVDLGDGLEANADKYSYIERNMDSEHFISYEQSQL